MPAKTPPYAPFDPAAVRAAYAVLDVAVEEALGRDEVPYPEELAALFHGRTPGEISVFFCRYVRDHLFREDRLWGAGTNHGHLKAVGRIARLFVGF